MNKAVLPTLLGVAVVVVGAIVAIISLKSFKTFKLGSSAEISPKSPRISNHTQNSFSISWTTNKKTKGVVLWGEKENGLTNKSADEDENETYIHLITIDGLKESTTYYFKIQSEGKIFGNNTKAWKTQTGPVLKEPLTPTIIAGKILTSSGTPASDVLVHAVVESSLPITTVTKDDGSWIMSLGYARSKNLKSYININETNSLVEINVLAGPLGAAEAKIYPVSAKPAPPIILGKAYDFKSLKTQDSSEIPEAELSAPKNSTTSSGFEIPISSEIESESK